MSALKEALTTAKIRRLQAEKQVKKAAVAYFEAEAKMLFDKHPEMEKFSWRQYTPFFNDGDECHFSARTDCLHINGDEVYSSKWNSKTGKYDPTNHPLSAAEATVKNFLAEFDDGDYEDMFGDHVKVTVTQAGTDVEEYDDHN
jgi:hypothetical protein